MIIRSAHIDEAALLTDLTMRSKASWGYDTKFMESCREGLTIHKSDITDPQNVIHVIEDGAHVMGFYFLRVKKSSLAKLRFFFMDPEFQRQGFGSALFANVVTVAREKSILSITIESDPYAQAFYEKMGAVKVGESTSESITGCTLPLMEYRINR